LLPLEKIISASKLCFFSLILGVDFFTFAKNNYHE
jgi:hypothetical protein